MMNEFDSLVKVEKDKTGRIIKRDTTDADALMSNARKTLMTMTPAQRIKNRPRGRNQVCYCGSGKKLKSCCGRGL